MTAWTDDGLVMAAEHRRRRHYGVQFHPESYLSRCGMDILARFLRSAEIDLRPEWNVKLAESHSPAKESVS